MEVFPTYSFLDCGRHTVCCISIPPHFSSPWIECEMSLVCGVLTGLLHNLTLKFIRRPDRWMRVPLAIVRKPPAKVKKVFEVKDKDEVEVRIGVYLFFRQFLISYVTMFDHKASRSG